MKLPQPLTFLKIILLLVVVSLVVDYNFKVTTYDYSTILGYTASMVRNETTNRRLQYAKMADSRKARRRLCPENPPDLVGPLAVLTNITSFEETELEEPELEPGGKYWPPDCTSIQKVAIVIAYRNREDHLKMFLHHMHPFLQRQQLDYGIYVVEQNGTGKFNRAALMNIGFAESLRLYDYDCFVFHDVDMLPEDDRNIYRCDQKHPRHMTVSVDKYNYKLPYGGYFGGVSAMTRKQFDYVNGFSNEFWGWGGEDDDLWNRVYNNGLQITRYPEEIARYKMSRHKEEVPSPERFEKLDTGHERENRDGLSNLESIYKTLNITFYKLYTRILVELYPPIQHDHHHPIDKTAAIK